MLATAVAPQRFVAERLANPAPLQELLVRVVSPLASIRAVAVLLRSVVVGSTVSGVVLGLGSFMLQIGTWFAVCLILPTLARQFNETVDERQAFALTTYASVPLWVAGLLYTVPEELSVVFVWSRLAVLLVALYGLYVMYVGLALVEIQQKARLPLLGTIALAYLIIYAVLFTLLGITSHIAIFLLG